MGVGITTVKQACQNLSLAAPLVFFATIGHCFSYRSKLGYFVLDIFLSTVGLRFRLRFSGRLRFSNAFLRKICNA